MSWYYIGTTWMSRKCQHCWNYVPLTRTGGRWHYADIFPWQLTDESRRFIEQDGFHTHCCCMEQPFCTLWRHRSESTGFHIDVFPYVSHRFSSKLETFGSSGNVYLCHLTNIPRMYFDNFPSPSLLVECQRLNIMRWMVFDARFQAICFVGRKTNVMILWHVIERLSWDLLPRVRGFWSWFGGVCSLTYCNGNFRVTVVSEPFNVILWYFYSSLIRRLLFLHMNHKLSSLIMWDIVAWSGD